MKSARLFAASFVCACVLLLAGCGKFYSEPTVSHRSNGTTALTCECREDQATESNIAAWFNEMSEVADQKDADVLILKFTDSDYSIFAMPVKDWHVTEDGSLLLVADVGKADDEGYIITDSMASYYYACTANSDGTNIQVKRCE